MWTDIWCSYYVAFLYFRGFWDYLIFLYNFFMWWDYGYKSFYIRYEGKWRFIVVHGLSIAASFCSFDHWCYIKAFDHQSSPTENLCNFQRRIQLGRLSCCKNVISVKRGQVPRMVIQQVTVIVIQFTGWHTGRTISTLVDGSFICVRLVGIKQGGGLILTNTKINDQ